MQNKQLSLKFLFISAFNNSATFIFYNIILALLNTCKKKFFFELHLAYFLLGATQGPGRKRIKPRTLKGKACDLSIEIFLEFPLLAGIQYNSQ